ncbi:hypothetical protein GCM10023192_89100 [Amycolatopsis samaneae]
MAAAPPSIVTIRFGGASNRGNGGQAGGAPCPAFLPPMSIPDEGAAAGVADSPAQALRDSPATRTSAASRLGFGDE